MSDGNSQSTCWQDGYGCARRYIGPFSLEVSSGASICSWVIRKRGVLFSPSLASGNARSKQACKDAAEKAAAAILREWIAVLEESQS